MEKLGLNLGYIIVQILNFAVLFVVLRAWVYKPLLGLMDRRRQTIAQGLEDARIASEARANAEREANKVLQEAQVKAAEIVREAAERAVSAGQEIRTAQDAELLKIRETALAEVEQERNLMLAELRGQVVTLAMTAAQRLIGQSLLDDHERQQVLLKEFFSGVRNGKVVILDDNAAPGSAGCSAEVTSALPLTGDEKEAVKKELMRTLGGAADISFKADPSILGGLIIKVGDRVVDGSVSGRLQNLRQNLA